MDTISEHIRRILSDLSLGRAGSVGAASTERRPRSRISILTERSRTSKTECPTAIWGTPNATTLTQLTEGRTKWTTIRSVAHDVETGVQGGVSDRIFGRSSPSSASASQAEVVLMSSLKSTKAMSESKMKSRTALEIAEDLEQRAKQMQEYARILRGHKKPGRKTHQTPAKPS